jgi:hypothetical protein
LLDPDPNFLPLDADLIIGTGTYLKSDPGTCLSLKGPDPPKLAVGSVLQTELFVSVTRRTSKQERFFWEERWMAFEKKIDSYI